MTVEELFSQKVWWVNREGDPVRVSTIDDDYLLNLENFLLNHSEFYFIRCRAAQKDASIAMILDDAKLDSYSKKWMESTELFTRIQELKIKRAI